METERFSETTRLNEMPLNILNALQTAIEQSGDKSLKDIFRPVLEMAIRDQELDKEFGWIGI
jgi:hypothetical protein